jgi:radical SAM superfamily enzyme
MNQVIIFEGRNINDHDTTALLFVRILQIHCLNLHLHGNICDSSKLLLIEPSWMRIRWDVMDNLDSKEAT